MRYCICGHTFISHEKEGCSPIIGWGIQKPSCPKDCKNFKQDNLKYLEDLYNERIRA